MGLVKEGPNVVLDLGCGSGAVGKTLRETGRAAELVGVELFEAAAAQAREFYSRVYTGDIEELQLSYHRSFDYVLCGDILEHLKDPYSVVRRIRGWLKDDGYLICSVPNVRHWRIITNLMFRGAWDYEDAGILDRTHLRFFTRKTCFRMLEDASFSVVFSRMLISGRKYLLLNALTFKLFDDLLGSQIVTVARKKVQTS